MTDQGFDDKAIAALADGELAPADAALLEAAAATDPTLARRIDQARRLRQAAASAFDAVMSEAPPARLVAAIEGRGQVVDLASARPIRARRHWWRTDVVRWSAAAAAMALAFVAGRYLDTARVSASGAIVVGPGGGLFAADGLAHSLQTQLASSQAPDAPVRIGVSFRDIGGAYCRTFILRQRTPIAGLACRGAKGWAIRTAAQAPPISAHVYQTAGDETPAPVLEMVDEIISGAPLDAAGEAKARAAGWGAPRSG